MKTLIKSALVALFVAASAFVVAGLLPSSVSAQEEPAEQTEEQQDENNDQENRYSYVAQPGDSYTKIARKAVQTYGFHENVSLTQAGIVYAETHLTLNAGSPELSVGQAVELDQADIASIVEKAKNLSEAEQAEWNYYVQFVDFNTDSVGEARE